MMNYKDLGEVEKTHPTIADDLVDLIFSFIRKLTIRINNAFTPAFLSIYHFVICIDFESELREKSNGEDIYRISFNTHWATKRPP